MKIMAFGPITSWQIDGETMETETLFLEAPKSLQMMTATMKLKDACSFEEKLTNLYKFFKSRDITLLKKFSIIKAIFPIVMYGCDSWSIKNGE